MFVIIYTQTLSKFILGGKKYMKKVFACLSAIVLMLVAFGLFAKPVMVSAVEVEEGKFAEDPTLEEGDLPIYVMNSIHTTFPAHHDNKAAPDANYQIGRDYYWNEIKLVVPRFEGNAPTGEQYTVYTQGSYNSSTKNAAATKIYIWGVHEGQVKTGTVTGGNASYTGTYPPLFGDVSLSGVRYNVSGQEVVVDNIYYENGVVNGDGQTDCIYIIFDGQGKAVRGAAHDNYFVAENVEAYGFQPIFGLKDGKIVIREDIVGGQAVHGFGASDEELDKEQLQVPNPNDPVLDPVTGEPMFDEETGEPLYNTMTVEGEEPAIYMGTRYVWQWYSEEDFAEQKVNTVQYMQEGWLADRWDYAYADPNGGYVCLAFAPSLAKFAKTTDAQAAIHNASVRAMLAAQEISQEEADELLIAETVAVDPETQEETVTYTHVARKVIISLVIPVDGISYRYGYLDYAGGAVVDMHFNKWCKLWESGLLYGRNEEYRAYARAYNFSGTGLETKNAVVDGQSYIIREESGKLLVEIKEGARIDVSELIKIQGMLGGYNEAGKPAASKGSNVSAVLSYKQMDVSNLSYQLDINGEHIMWLKRYKYESVMQAANDLLPVLIEWKASKGVTIAADTTWAQWTNNTYAKFSDGDFDLFVSEHPEWAWFMNWFKAEFEAQAAIDSFTGYTLAQANGFRFGLWAFVNATKHGSWPYSPNFVDYDYSGFWDVCPEPDPFLYESMDELIEAFTEAYAAYYNKSESLAELGLAGWSDMMEGPCGAADWHYDDFFNANPEWKFFLTYYTQEIANTPRSNGDAWAYDVTSKFAWRQAFQAWALKYAWGSWPYSPDFTNRSEEAYFIGINAVMPTWNEAEYIVPDSIGFMDTFTLDLDVTNGATGFNDKLQITFQMVKEFTPIIKIDESMLKVESVPGEVQKIDLSKVFSAWDCVYKEGGNGVYGSDISRQYLEIIAPAGFDPNNLKAGNWELEAIAKCPNETGIVSKAKAVIKVSDVTAPEIRLIDSTIYVLAGQQLKASDVLQYAVDDAEGDLFKSTNKWYVLNTGGYDPESAEVGDSFSAKIRVYDTAGNEVVANFLLTVTGIEVVVPEQGGQGGQGGQGQGGQGSGSQVEEEEAGCVSLAYVSSFIAAAGLALIILKKKH